MRDCRRHREISSNPKTTSLCRNTATISPAHPSSAGSILRTLKIRQQCGIACPSRSGSASVRFRLRVPVVCHCCTNPDELLISAARDPSFVQSNRLVILCAGSTQTPLDVGRTLIYRILWPSLSLSPAFRLSPVQVPFTPSARSDRRRLQQQRRRHVYEPRVIHNSLADMSQLNRTLHVQRPTTSSFVHSAWQYRYRSLYCLK
jgi:hypothetical protein